MSGEDCQRTIVTTLLTMAGLRDTVLVDAEMHKGHAHHYRRGMLMDARPEPVPLHTDARDALRITGYGDQPTPAWMPALVALLRTAAHRGNRHAILTERFLVGGWNAVAPYLTEDDRAWLLATKRVGIRVPEAWDVWLTIRSAAAIGRHLPDAVNAVVLTDILDALVGVDDVPPAAVRTVTPLQVLRFVLGGLFPSRADMQHVLRAILDGTTVVRETVARLHAMGWHRTGSLSDALIGRALHPPGRSVEQSGIDAVLEMAAAWIQTTGGGTVVPSALRDLSPAVIQTMTHLLQNGWHGSSDLAGLSLTALMHIWQTGGWDAAMEHVVQCLGQSLTSYPVNRSIFLSTVMPMITGIVRPPHGDAIMARLGDAADKDAWVALVASAVYAALCHRIGHVPFVVGIADRLRARWSYRRVGASPSPIPLLTVGRERELLLPPLHTARGTDAWIDMVLDVIDAVDMLDRIGGDPQPLLAVLADALTIRSTTHDPWIIIRLAASRYGQTILANLPNVDLPSVWCGRTNGTLQCRLVSHLVSPGWATSPPHLYDWWETTINRVAPSGLSACLDDPPPLYPTVLPQAAVIRPSYNLVTRALAHPRWGDVPAAERRACLDTALGMFVHLRQGRWVPMVIHATSDTAVHDVCQMIPSVFAGKEQNRLRRLINPKARRSA